MRSLVVLAALVAASALASAASALGNGKIAFAWNSDVWTVDPATRTQANLTSDIDNRGGIHAYGPLWWSPDGAQLLFGRALELRTSDGNQFFSGFPAVMDADGGGKRILVNDRTPFWSPVCWLTSDEIVVERAPYRQETSDLFVVHPDATGLHAFTSDGAVKTPSPPPGTCAPGGERVAYSAGDYEHIHNYTVSVTDGRPVEVGPALAGVALSPDGERVAFARDDGVFTERVDGTGLVKLSGTPAWGVPAWSPDGRSIAFVDRVLLGTSYYGDPYYTSDLRIVDAAGTETRLTDGLRINAIGWSPDGTRLALVGNGVWMVNADGSCETLLADRVDSGYAPAWQPVPGKETEPPISCADLGTNASANQTPVPVGGSTRIEISVANEGNENASDVVLSFTSVAGQLVSFDPSQGACSLPPAAECRLGRLAPGEQAHVDATVASTLARVTSGRLGPASAVGLQLRVSAPEPDGNATNDTAYAYAPAYGCTILGTRDFDRLIGTAEDDSICGLDGDDRLFGLEGDDYLAGGPGDDRIYGGSGRDAVFAGGGNDVVFAHDGVRDTVDCGDNEDDVLLADRFDVAKNCESVSRSPIKCALVGTRHNDDLVGKWWNDAICGLQGNDSIRGGEGNDAIDGGQGNDTISGGRGRDLIFAGGGYDVVLARDSYRDRIACGSEIDTVVADRIDRVARNCENVLLPPRRGRR